MMKCTCSVSYLLNRNALYSGWVKKVTEGYLGKKRHKKYYAVIHDSVLYLYDDETSSSTSKVNNVSQYKIEQKIETHSGVTIWGFCLHQENGEKDGEVLQFSVGSEREMNEWLTNLKSCKLSKGAIADDGTGNSYIQTPVRRLSKEQSQVCKIQDTLCNPQGKEPSLPISEAMAHLRLRGESLPSPIRNSHGINDADSMSRSFSLAERMRNNNNSSRTEIPLQVPSYLQHEKQHQEHQNEKQFGIVGRPQMPLPPVTSPSGANELMLPIQQNRLRSDSGNSSRKMSAQSVHAYEVSDGSKRHDRKLSSEQRLPATPTLRKEHTTRNIATDDVHYEDLETANADALYAEHFMPSSVFKWSLDRAASNDLLSKCATPGVYIIRKGKDKKDVISAYLLGEVRHYKIFTEDDEMFLHHDHPHFKRHLHMIMYYHKNNLPTCHARLETPYR